MASFTDQTPQFNPYVQQLPIEAMVKVGMEKQQRYDEGVQKIQTSIDNVAGLDIVKDSDKQYLQTQLNQLGSRLKTVAAGDFSNYQLVNSVGGMATQIGKDKNIQNAVSATAKLRKEQQRKEKAIQEGKSSVDNEWYFNNQVSKYLDNAEVGESFNGQYVDYTDINKKLRDLHSKLKEVDKSVDNPFIRDNSGKTLYYSRDSKGNEVASTDPSKGQAKYDYTMLTTKVKGIGAEKILNNFYDSLDENDKRQLNITAQYHYRNSTSQTFQNDIVTTYNTKKNIYEKAIVDATVKLATAKLTAEEKKALENDINKAKALVFEGGFDKQMNEELSQVDTEEEASTFKYKTYTQKYLTNLAKDLDNETISTEFKNNPGRQAILDQKKFEFDIQKERQREREWGADYALKVRTDAREERKEQKENEAEEKLKPLVSAQKISTDFTKYGMIDLQEDMNKASDNLKQTTNKLATLLDPNAKTPAEIKTALTSANELYMQYRTNPQSINDNRQRKLLEQIDYLDNEQYKLSSVYNAAKKAGAVFNQEADKVIDKQKGLKLGNNFFSPRDLYNFQNEANKYIKTSTVMTGPDTFQRNSKMTDQILEKSKGTKNYTIALALYNKANNLPLSAGQKVIINQLEAIDKNVSSDIKSLKEKQTILESKTINDLSPQFQKMNIQINKDNKVDMSVVDQIIGAKTKDYNEFGALDSDRPDDFSPSKLEEMKEKGNLGFTYVKDNSGGATLVATAGSDVQKIPLTPQEFSTWVNKYSYLNPMTDVVSAVQSSPGKTTNKGNTKQGSTARYTGFSPLVPLLNNQAIASKVRFDIEGDSDNTGNTSTDLFQARIYYHNGKNFQDEVLNPGGYLNAYQLQLLLNQIGPKTVDTLFK